MTKTTAKSNVSKTTTDDKTLLHDIKKIATHLKNINGNIPKDMAPSIEVLIKHIDNLVKEEL